MVSWANFWERRKPLRTGCPKLPITVSKEENSRSLPSRLVKRVRLIVMAAEGTPSRAIAQKIELSSQMVCKWRQRYVQQGLSALMMNWRPRSVSDEKVAVLIRKTLHTKPHDGTQWTSRSVDPRRPHYPDPPCIGFGKPSGFNPIDNAILNSPLTPSL